MTIHRLGLLFVCTSATFVALDSAYAKERVTYTPAESRKYEAKPVKCELEIIVDAKPDRAYVALGIVNYHDERHRSKAGSLKLDVAMPSIKAEACKAGGDALIDIRTYLTNAELSW